MKGICDREDLLYTLKKVYPAVATRTTMPVLTHFHIAARKGGLTISATDLEVFVSSHVACDVEMDGAACVPARILLDFVAAADGDSITFEQGPSAITFSTRGSWASLRTVSASEFPREGDDEAQDVMVLEGWTLAEAIGRTVFVPDVSHRPALSGVFWDAREERVRLVASDSYRMAIARLPEVGQHQPFSAILPTRALRIVAGLALPNERVILSVLGRGRQVKFALRDADVVTQVIEENYPDYTTVVPKEFAQEIAVDRDELISAVTLAKVFFKGARDASRVLLSPGDDGMLWVSGAETENGSGRARVPILSARGDRRVTMLNGDYLLSGLKAMSEGTVRIKSPADRPGPIVIAPKEGEEWYTYLVMPMIDHGAS